MCVCVCVCGFKLKVSTCHSMSYGGWCVLIGEIGVAISSVPSARKTSHSATASSAIAGSAKEHVSSPVLSATLSATALTNTSSIWLPSMESIHRRCSHLYGGLVWFMSVVLLYTIDFAFGRTVESFEGFIIQVIPSLSVKASFLCSWNLIGFVF